MRLLFPIAAPSHHTIKALFLRSGITHAELAMLAGVSDSSWFRYLSGQSPMPYENWLALNAQIYMINTGIDLYWNAPRDVLNLAPAPKPLQKNYDVVLPNLEGTQIFDAKEAAVQNTPKETESERRRLDTERLDARAARFSVEHGELKADYEADRNSLPNVPDMHIDLRIEFTKDKRKKMDALCTQYGMYDDQYENDIEQLNQYKLSRKHAREAKIKDQS